MEAGKAEYSRKRSATVDSDAAEAGGASRRRRIDVEPPVSTSEAPSTAPTHKFIREDTIILDPKPQFIRQDTFTIEETADEKCPSPEPHPPPTPPAPTSPTPHPQSSASSSKHSTPVVRGECCKYQIQEVRHLRRLLSDAQAATATQVRRERQASRRQREALEIQLRQEAAVESAERDRHWRREVQQARRRQAELELQLKEAKRLQKACQPAPTPAATPPVQGLRVGRSGACGASPGPGRERKKPPTRPSTPISTLTVTLSTQTDSNHDDSATQTEVCVVDGEVQCDADGCVWIEESLVEGLRSRVAVLKENPRFRDTGNRRCRSRKGYPPFQVARPVVKRLGRSLRRYQHPHQPRDWQEGKYKLHTNEYGQSNPPMRHFNKLEPVVESSEDADVSPTSVMVVSGSVSGSPGSSGPSSLSPTPCIADLWTNLNGACNGVRGNSVTDPSVHFWHTDSRLESQRLKNDNAQAKICELRQELQSALKCRDSAVLAAACAAQNLDRAMAELADLREQNELLEFRLLELEGDKIEELRPEVQDKATTTDAELSCLETLSDAVRQLRRLSEHLKGGDSACAARAVTILDEYILTRAGKKTSSSTPTSPSSNRIVATVLPFSTPQSSPGAADVAYGGVLNAAAADEARLKRLEEFRKKKEFFSRKCSAVNDKLPVRIVHRTHSLDGFSDDTSPLQESGIFEADDDEPPEENRLSRIAAVEVSTQTDAGADAAAVAAAETSGAGNDDLRTEIQKLSQIRKRFQEHPARLKAAKTEILTNDVPPLPPQVRELEFLRQRAAELESRLAQIQLAGGDAVRGAARLLEREAVLQHQLKLAHEAAEQLRARARNLEEEKCELEEVENDTRLQCQRLEVELVGLRERQSALECELECVRRLPAEAAETATALQDLRNRHALLQRAVPALVAFALLEVATIWHQRMSRYLPAPCPKSLRDKNWDNLLEQLEVVSAAKRDLQLKVDFLEKKEAAFQETLAAADGLWADMEADYKRRLATAEEAAAALQERLRHLEASDVQMRAATRREQRALERVADLEAAEAALRGRLTTAEAEKAAAASEAARLAAELRAVHQSSAEERAAAIAPLRAALAEARRAAEAATSDAAEAREAAAAAEAAAAREAASASSKVRAADRALQDMEVTCAELREEVDTLEEAVSTLKTRLSAANEAVEQTACDAERRLAAKDRQIDELRRRFRDRSQPSALVDEMALAEASTTGPPPPPPPPRRPTVGFKPAAPPRPPTLMVMASRWNGNAATSQRPVPPPQAAR